ncbi:MAG: hypothetical protein L0I62_00375 [Gammaproteobacteria bacterium]|nr:hypothetical protein [Gammaproteobacteria bacterium]
MNEYHVAFRKVIIGADPDILARVSDTDDLLVDTVETIRAGIGDSAREAQFDLNAIPNGHFMEIEFLLDGQAVQGVVFMTPYLPDRFVTIVREVLSQVGIENVFC